MNASPFPDPYAQVARDAMTTAPARGRGELTISPAELPDPSTIPPRRWLYGRLLIKGFITVLVAAGGIGKTAWSMSAVISMASGRAKAGDWVYQRVPVLCCTLEDPEEEFNRRLAASMIHHDIGRDELRGYVFVISGRDRQLLIAAIDTDNFTICYPDKARMVERVRAQGIGLIVVDPFVNSHELDENNNPHINAAARAWAEIAHEADCAVLLVHHTRKGALAGDIEGSRGAKALTDASRVGLTLTAMTPEEAESYGIAEQERRLHIRLDDGKANLAPPSDKARWFRLVGVSLGNGEPGTPWDKPDNVQAVETWEPVNALALHTPAQLNVILDRIAEGPSPGTLYSGNRRGGSDRWAGSILVEAFEITDRQANFIISQWLKTGLLIEDQFRDPKARRDMKGVRVDDSKRPEI